MVLARTCRGSEPATAGLATRGAAPAGGIAAKLVLAALAATPACYVEADARDDDADDSSSTGASGWTSTPATDDGSSSDTDEAESATAAAGSADGGGTTGDVGGCTLDLDCGDDNPCTLDVCGADGCNNIQLDGLRTPDQVAGDCLVAVCADGHAQAVPDPNDLPDDGNDCTADACDDGAAAHLAMPVGAPCADGVGCDGRGTCDECVSPDTCDGFPPDDDCQVRTCEAGACGQAFAPAGAPVNPTLQTPGDCQRVVCDGVGGMMAQADGADPHVDGLECTDDACVQGAPNNAPLPSGTACAAGECNANGQCVGCNAPEDCGVSTNCQTMSCSGQGICGVVNVAAGAALPPGEQTDGDCQQLQCDGDGAAVSLVDADDAPADDGFACTAEVCIGGLAQHPDEPAGTACAVGDATLCDGTGECVACLADETCPAAAAQCEVARCLGGACGVEPSPLGTPCADGLFCTTGDACDGAGACLGAADPCPGPDGDGDCSESCDEADDTCDADDADGSPCDDGAICSEGDECAEGVCGGIAVDCPGPQSCSEDCGGCCND